MGFIQEVVNLAVGIRKLIAILTLYAMGIYMQLHGHLTSDQFVCLCKSTTIAYFGANGVEHVSLAAKNIFGKGTNG